MGTYHLTKWFGVRPNKALNLTELAEYNLMPIHENESSIATRGEYLDSRAVLRRLAPVR